MKQYPSLLEDIWNNIRSLSEAVKNLEAQTREKEVNLPPPFLNQSRLCVQIKTQDHSREISAEQKRVDQRLSNLEQHIEEISTWRLGQEETIKAHRSAAEQEFHTINKMVESLDKDLNKAQKVCS